MENHWENVIDGNDVDDGDDVIVPVGGPVGGPVGPVPVPEVAVPPPPPPMVVLGIQFYILEYSYMEDCRLFFFFPLSGVIYSLLI